MNKDATYIRFMRKGRLAFSITIFSTILIFSCSSSVSIGTSDEGKNYTVTTTTIAGGTTTTTIIDSSVRSINCTNWQTLHPDWVFCDDFEDGSWLSSPEWDASDGHGPDGSEGVKCDGDIFGFIDKCAAYSGVGYFDSYWGYDNHYGRAGLKTSGNEFYLRIYLYFSDPYEWGDTSDKGIYFEDSTVDTDSAGATPNIKMEYSSWGSGKANIASYPLSGERRTQNLGNDISWKLKTWYLVEFYVKLNTPGQANGIARLWIDEAVDPQVHTLRLEYTDLLIRSASQANGYNRIFLTDYHQRCDLGASCPEIVDQWLKWDNIAVSTKPIGP
jgi:hypothetical protein